MLASRCARLAVRFLPTQQEFLQELHNFSKYTRATIRRESRCLRSLAQQPCNHTPHEQVIIIAFLRKVKHIDQTVFRGCAQNILLRRMESDL